MSIEKHVDKIMIEYIDWVPMWAIRVNSWENTEFAKSIKDSKICMQDEI